MIPEKRRQEIIDTLQREQVTTLANLSSKFRVSRVTIQRDISLLEEKGLVKKVHGGVKIGRPAGNHFETRFRARMEAHYAKKKEIALKALSLVKDERTIFLDSSTTLYIFSQELFKKKFIDLNIITTSPSIVGKARNYPDMKLICTGGQLKADFNMFCGSWVLDFLEHINIDTAFISAAGISQQLMLTTSDKDLANILAKVMERSKNINLLADSSKFFRQGMLNISHISSCRHVVTDSMISREAVKKLNTIHNLHLIY